MLKSLRMTADNLADAVLLVTVLVLIILQLQSILLAPQKRVDGVLEFVNRLVRASRYQAF